MRITAFCPKCLNNKYDNIWILEPKISSSIENFPFCIPVIALYCHFSSSERLSLSKRKSKRCASLPISSVIRYFALSKVNPSTLLSDRKITGYFPIYSSQSALFSAIYKPSNKEASAPVSKKARNMLMFKVFPKRRGRVNSVTSPPVSTNCSISFVLSM